MKKTITDSSKQSTPKQASKRSAAADQSKPRTNSAKPGKPIQPKGKAKAAAAPRKPAPAASLTKHEQQDHQVAYKVKKTNQVDKLDKANKSGLKLVLLTGVSGSGKSVALTALEDVGYFCVDNLPPELLFGLVAHAKQSQQSLMAVSIDSRSSKSLTQLPATLKQIKASCDLRILYLDTKNDVLLQRFSETRRKHPLTVHQRGKSNIVTRGALLEAIAFDRELLDPLHSLAHHIDTSDLSVAELRSSVKQFIQAQPTTMLLTIESFAFKHGLPLDADFVFDVRCLPNPYYERRLRLLTGKDTAVARFLARQPLVKKMQHDIGDFLHQWLQAFRADHRSYLTIAIGCTGGQHRSVYLAEQLASRFAKEVSVVVRHREVR